MEPNDELSEFVAEAHRNGYATSQPTVTDGRKEITYERGRWQYRDTYRGSTAFVGHEIVTDRGEPVWGMSYYGALTSPGGDREEIYAFLRDALERAAAARPYRGPDRFERGALEYSSAVDGDLARFEGREEITTDETVVYRGTFSGGRVD